MVTNYFTVEADKAGGSGAATLQFELSSDEPVHEFFLTMQGLEVTNLPTIAQVLTQVGSNITVRVGGSSVFSLSATDLFGMMNLARAGGLAAHQSDATGADNHSQVITLPIPLGPIGLFNDVHPDFGIDTRDKVVVVQVEIPADAEIDNRLFSLGFMSVEGKYPSKVVSRVTRAVTAPATGDGTYIALPSGPDRDLVDIGFFQTTGLTAGSTSDVVGVESFSLELNNEEKHLVDVLSTQCQTNLRNISLAATVPASESTYLYFNWDQPHSVEQAIPLRQRARININAGVAEAIRFFGGVTRKI